MLRNFTPGEYFRNAICQAVTQDATGIIYFGNASDVLTFDGATWGDIKLPPDSAGVRQFATTADGTIYLGGANVLGHLRNTGAGTEYVSLIGLLPPAEREVDEIHHVAAIGNTVYFSDENKLRVWRDGRFTIIASPTPLHSRGARLHPIGDTLYLTALDRPLRRLVDDKLEVVADHSLLRENQIISVEAAGAGALLLLTAERGFFQLADGRITPVLPEASRWLAGKRIFRALRLPDDSLVVAFSAVSGDGGMRFAADGRYLGPIDTTTGLVVKTLRAFHADREGGLWLGLEAGNARFEWPGVATVFDVANGLGQGAVADVVRHQGTLYAATNEGVFRLIPMDATGRGARFERILPRSATALVSHPSGLLVLGFADVLVQSPAGFASVAKLPSDSSVLRQSKRDPSRVWIGTARGLHSIRHTTRGWHHEGPVPGFDEHCRGVSEAADGSLWVATPGRDLFRLVFTSSADSALPPARVERFAGGHGLPESYERAATLEFAGETVFTFDTTPRPYRFDATQRQFVPLAKIAALPAASVADDTWIAAGSGDTPGAAQWLASASSIYRLSPEGRPAQKLPHMVPAAAGAIARLREETTPDGPALWIAGANGLVRVDVPRAFPAPVPFAVQLRATGVRAGDRLTHEHTPLSFTFVAPRFRIASNVAYQTRLVGLERDWSEWSPQGQRAFTSLPPDRYRFEVRARDADGVLSAPASFAFAVLAPWWRTPWALLGYAAAGTGLLGGLVRLRTRALRQRAQRLEAIVADRTRELGRRTSELARQNTELVRLHQLELDEKISARLAEEKARLEVLRYQLNPHFLFNTLASISASLPIGRSTARSMVERLAEFCRLTLHRTDDREWTTLGGEMRLLRSYLEIEQSRWGDLLDIAIDCDAALHDERLPHFLMLPLVENALKYGRATSPDRVGIRLVARRVTDGALQLDVSNTGAWIEPSARKTVSSLGIGLDNLRERLARYYPRTHQLVVVPADGWVTVRLTLSLSLST